MLVWVCVPVVVVVEVDDAEAREGWVEWFVGASIVIQSSGEWVKGVWVRDLMREI